MTETTASPSPALHRRAGPGAFLSLLLAAAPALAQTATTESPWPVVGRQGLVQHVIGPVEAAADEAAYERQVALLCPAEQTCFINFYTNSTQAPVAFPLPEAIAREATATYRRSMKNGVQVFTWSCRLQKPKPGCF